MRLLNVNTKRLEEFFEKTTPKYAILSHTWGEDEVTFRAFDPILGPRRTSPKIEGCCAQALKDGFDYVWIDTCCIDKSSSAELSEAINSMFAWYERAEICYVYLSDVRSQELDPRNEHSDFSTSRWFTRGWTLQELLAPNLLIFYNTMWHPLGCLAKQGGTSFGNVLLPSVHLERITNISPEFITGEKSLNMASIAMRMSWASRRQTTREEDIAYCLLGIFDIAMPMIYGEGTKAFMRLQEEILKNEDDLSIFAWGFGNSRGAMSCLATSPADFAGCGNLEDSRTKHTHSGHVAMTNKGLSIEMPIVRLVTGDYIGQLDAKIGHSLVCLAIPLVRHRREEDVFYRPQSNVPQPLNWRAFEHVNPKSIYISKRPPKIVRWSTGLRLSRAFLTKFKVSEVHPANWDLSLGWCYKAPDVGFPDTEVKILLGCSNKSGEMLVIRVDYRFQVVHFSDFVPFLRPIEATVFAAPLPPLSHGASLVGLIASKWKQVDQLMDWEEGIILDRVGAYEVNGEIRDGFTQRLHLDGSKRNMWKIDIIDMNDSETADSPIAHHMIGEPCDSEDWRDYPESISSNSDFETESLT